MVKTILIVEDNESHMMLYNDHLQANGYDTFQSVDGNDVLEIARNQMPDLIIMDIQLTERSGFEIIKDLKADEILKHIPVVAITAFAMKGDKQMILDAGCDDYIAKPIDVQVFLETVAKYLS